MAYTDESALDDQPFDDQPLAERVDAVLRHGWDGDVALARRIVARYPEISRTNIFTAAVCGDVAEVERQLTADPVHAKAQAIATGGPHAWTALACVTYSRIDAVHAVTIARMLLDAGADPGFQFDDGWDNAFTLVTGAIGQGEGVKATHPQAQELVSLLVERGADPFDVQALYNTSIVRDDITWTARLWDLCDPRDRAARWSQIEAPSIGGKIKVGTLNYLLGNAVASNHLARAAWLIDHGADPNTRHSYSGESLHTTARLSGSQAMLTLLAARGAQAESLDGERGLLASLMQCSNPDAEADVRARVSANPALLRSPVPLLTAAEHGNVHAVRLLVSLGAAVNATDHEGVTPLHRAAHAGSIETIDALLAAGADVDVRERKWRGTPMSWAVVTGRRHVAAHLAPITRDVRALAMTGRVDRLAAVLHDEPGLATHRLVDHDSPTPLFCLPDNESAAVEVVRLLLANSADLSVRNRVGKSAEEVARFRGLDEAAEMMATHG